MADLSKVLGNRVARIQIPCFLRSTPRDGMRCAITRLQNGVFYWSD